MSKSGRTIRLPTDEEWAAAATALQGEFPWGDAEPNPELLNYAVGESFEAPKPNVGRPKPIGIYPAGAGPHGHLELAGNVFEWTSTLKDQLRVIRGGSWSRFARDCRPASRRWDAPGYRTNDLGFRLAAVQ